MEISVKEFNEMATIINDLKAKTINGVTTIDKNMKINISNYEMNKISDLLSKWNKSKMDDIKNKISYDSEFVIRCKVYAKSTGDIDHLECTFE